MITGKVLAITVYIITSLLVAWDLKNSWETYSGPSAGSGIWVVLHIAGLIIFILYLIFNNWNSPIF